MRTPEQAEAMLQAIETMPARTDMKETDRYGYTTFTLVYQNGRINKKVGYISVKVVNPGHKSVAPFRPLPNIIQEGLRLELLNILTDEHLSIGYWGMPASSVCNRGDDSCPFTCYNDDTGNYSFLS